MPLVRATLPRPVGMALGLKQIEVLISSGTLEERWAAVREAAELPPGLDMLSKALVSETASRVREAIFTGLARIGTPASAAVVATYLRSDDSEVRTGALDALRAMPAATAPHLLNLLRDDDPDVRLLACELVRNQPPDAANAMMSSLLASDPEANVCAAAVEVLAEIGDLRAVPVLQRCAARFPDDPFLAFAISAAVDRIGSQASSRD